MIRNVRTGIALLIIKKDEIALLSVKKDEIALLSVKKDEIALLIVKKEYLTIFCYNPFPNHLLRSCWILTPSVFQVAGRNLYFWY